jgi:hypothetical protein
MKLGKTKEGYNSEMNLMSALLIHFNIWVIALRLVRFPITMRYEAPMATVF